MFEQALDRDFRGDLCGRPRRAQSAVQADSGQDIHAGPGVNVLVFDGVEVVHLGAFVGELGQEPSRKRSRSSNSFATIQRTASRLDPHESGHGRDYSLAALLQLPVNGLGAVLPQIALGSQLTSDHEHPLLDPRLGPLRRHTPPTSRATQSTCSSGKSPARETQRCTVLSDTRNDHTTAR